MTYDLISLLYYVGLPVMVIVVSLVLLSPGRRNPPEIATEEYICGCTHHLSFHDDEGKCRSWHRHLRRETRDSEEWDIRPCPCQRYIGPLPIDDELQRVLDEGEPNA